MCAGSPSASSAFAFSIEDNSNRVGLHYLSIRDPFFVSDLLSGA